MTDDDIGRLTLDVGAHPSAEDGHSLLEVVSMFAGEAFSNRPQCVDPVIAAFASEWNDGVDDVLRQDLKRYVSLLPGTNKGAACARVRGCMAFDWIVRTCIPSWCMVLPVLHPHAQRLRQLAPVTDEQSLAAAIGELPGIRAAAIRAAVDAHAARPWATEDRAMQVAAWDAAWAAARYSCLAAARAAVTAITWDPAARAAQEAAGMVHQWVESGAVRRGRRHRDWLAARQAALTAAQAIEWAAGRFQARAGAWNTALDVIRTAAWQAACAHRERGCALPFQAANLALRPMQEALQASAHELMQEMIATRL